MSGGIYLLQHDGKLLEMREQPYDNENILQKLLADYPNLLAGDLIDHDAPRRWLLIRREIAVPSGEDKKSLLSLDHLFLDQDAVPTLVEVKRSSDVRLRREVVGQMLDYAANAVANWSIEEIRGRYAAACEADNLDPDFEIQTFIGDNMTADEFWQKAEENLRTGKIRLLFVADEIPMDLRRIVEFLNRQMHPAEVLAVEIKQYSGESVKTLVPRVYGQTVETQEKSRKASTTRKQWDEESFFLELANRTDKQSVKAAQFILEWAKSKTLIWWGKGARTGSFVPYILHKDISHPLFAVYTYSKLEIYFYWYAYKPPFDDEAKRLLLLEKLNNIDGVKIPKQAIAKRPSISLSILNTREKIDQFLAIFDWFLDVVKKT
ncbi:hypothetical protein EH223_12420 [candidate division KSB1 bacterium]|nr:hypothetical protein [candidate division KSB1 bacterium]RQW02500.1 MAG: hypothetical protein EH223_12420 [candidate division KSB1 bacterium]